MFPPGSSIHFIGICGTAMASVAVALKKRGYHVTGSDANVYPPMSTFLEENKIQIHSGYRAENLPSTCDLVVVGNAISRGNPELEALLDQKRAYLSLPETLKFFFLRGRRNLVVTGTHGKTTTTSLLTWILTSSGLQPSYMIGGIPKNLGQGACFQDSDWTVLEGDEYDTAFFDKRSKFLHYLPEVVILNNIEFDHADIYENLDAIKLTFRRLVNLVPRNGMIFANSEDPVVREVVAHALCPIQWVGMMTTSPSHQIDCLDFRGDKTYFQMGDQKFELRMTGAFNARNAAMAISVARHIGISDKKIAEAVSSFEGVRRRQEIRATVNGITLIDDFGHHPTAIRETLTALRKKYPEQRLWAFFEPRSNTTRRAVFQKELPEALALADGVFVSQVARLDQLPEENRLDAERVMNDIRQQGRIAFYLPDVSTIVSQAVQTLRPNDVAVIFSNGGFGGIHEQLIQSLGK